MAKTRQSDQEPMSFCGVQSGSPGPVSRRGLPAPRERMQGDSGFLRAPPGREPPSPGPAPRLREGPCPANRVEGVTQAGPRGSWGGTGRREASARPPRPPGPGHPGRTHTPGRPCPFWVTSVQGQAKVSLPPGPGRPELTGGGLLPSEPWASGMKWGGGGDRRASGPRGTPLLDRGRQPQLSASSFHSQGVVFFSFISFSFIFFF